VRSPRIAWWPEAFRQVHLDFHIPEFPRDALANFDADRFVDHLQRGRVAQVTLFAKDHFGNSFYHTEVGHRHAALSDDILMEVARRCHDRGIRTLAYYSLCWENRAWDENPDWRYRDAEGVDRREPGQFGHVCMNTGYKDELVMPQLREIVERYPVDGLWLDIPSPGGTPRPGQLCHCSACRNKWRQRFGHERLEELSPREQLRLDMATIEDYLLETRVLLDDHQPDWALVLNCVGKPVINRRIKQLCDAGTWESQPHAGDYLRHSYAARLGRNDITDLQIMTVRFYEWWGDLSLKPAAQLTTECAAIIGNGQVVSVGDQANVDASLQPPAYDVLAESFGFVAEREELIADAESVRHAVVLLPGPDPHAPLAVTAADCEETYPDHPAWRGVHKMLIESHIQVDLACEALADDLDDMPMILLPEPAGYAPATLERLREYVRNGGLLVVAGNATICEGQFHLADVLGLNYIEPLNTARPDQQVVHFKPHASLQADLPDLPLQLRGRAAKVTLDGATEVASLWLPEATYQPNQRFRNSFPPAAANRSPFPFATVNEFGKGKAAYIAGSIFQSYWRWNHHWLRVFVERLLRSIDPAMPYNIDAAGKIEANLMRIGDDLLMNLIHYDLQHGGDGQSIAGIERVHPVHEITCRVRSDACRAVRLEPCGTELEFSHKNDLVTFTVPTVEYLAMVRIIR
jgi:hypothetical protein